MPVETTTMLQHVPPTPDTDSTDTGGTGETAGARLVDVIALAEHNGSVIATVKNALLRAGLDDASALRFRPDEATGLLYALALNRRVDGRSDAHARIIPGNWRVTLPDPDAKAAFGLSPDDVATAVDQPLVAVYALTDRKTPGLVLTMDRQRSVPAGPLVALYEESEAGEVLER